MGSVLVSVRKMFFKNTKAEKFHMDSIAIILCDATLQNRLFSIFSAIVSFNFSGSFLSRIALCCGKVTNLVTS